MILLKVIFYLLVFFPFLCLGDFGSSLDISKRRNTERISLQLKELANAGFIGDTSRNKWRSLDINHISDQFQKQCRKSYFGLRDVVREYNEGYRGLEKENEDWMEEKIEAVISSIKSCREEIRRAYVKFSHEVIVPLHRAYNMDTSASKDNFQYLDVNFVRDLQGTVIPEGSRFWILRSILVDIKNWKHICVKGERGVKRKGFIIFSSEIV